MIHLNKKQIIGIIFFMALFIIIILPLMGIIFSIHMAELKSMVLNTDIYESIKGSLVTTVSTVCITVPSSMLCAFCVTHTNIRFKTLFSFFCTLPLFLPPISFGFSLLAIFGKNGFLYSLLGIRIPLLGGFGVTFGLVLYTFPVSFLLLRNAMREIDGMVYESVVLLGISIIRYFFFIMIPQIRKTIICVCLLVFTMSLTEYGVCLVVGGKIKTLSLLIYRQIIGAYDFSGGNFFVGILILPIICMLIFEIICPQMTGRMTYKDLTVPAEKKHDIFAYIILISVSSIFLFIIFSFVIMCFSENYPVNLTFSLKNIIQVIRTPYIYYFVNSIMIACFVSVFGCFFAFGAAYFASKNTNAVLKKLFYFISTLPYMIPGLIFGIGYMIVYKGSELYNTFTIIILANIAHFFSSPFLLAYHSFCNMSLEYEEIAQLYEIPKKHMFFNVYVPYMRNTFWDMFFYYFTNSMITISAVVFLYTDHTMPYSLILKNFEGSIEYLSRSSSVSLVILLTNLFVFMIISLFKSK